MINFWYHYSDNELELENSDDFSTVMLVLQIVYVCAKTPDVKVKVYRDISWENFVQ